jgi:hypothetical protein
MNLRGIQMGLKWNQRRIKKGLKGIWRNSRRGGEEIFLQSLLGGKIKCLPISLMWLERESKGFEGNLIEELRGNKEKGFLFLWIYDSKNSRGIWRSLRELFIQDWRRFLLRICALQTPNRTTQNQLKNTGTLLQSILYECHDLLTSSA